VTAERRLARLEASLSPTQLVLRWLDEAHAFGDLESYVRSQLAEPSSEGPLDRLAREAASGVRVSLRGKRPEILDAAVASALRETAWGSETPIRSCGRPVVLVDEPTEQVPPANVAGVDRDRLPGCYER
jgi:hypothetical protein